MLTYRDPAALGVKSPSSASSNLVPVQTLLSLGWVLISGQAAALLMVFFRSGIHPTLGYSVLLIVAFAALNLSLQRAWRQDRENQGWISNRQAGTLLALFLGQLTLFFTFTGGVLNPFIILLFGPVTVSATALSRRMTSALILLAIALMALLTLVYIDLPWRNRTGALEALILPLDYRAATWTALVISLVFLSLFISWQSDLAKRTAHTLEASRLALEREQTLANVGGLAAAAAHELGTPLATIAVAAREMADVLTDQNADPSLIEDAQLLVEETARCRQIIASLAVPNSAAGHEEFLRLDLGEILQRAVVTHGHEGITFIFHREGDPDMREPHPPRQPELIHGLGNIVQNAFQFAASSVTARLRWDAETLTLIIQDDGPGYPPAVLSRLGQPYVRGGDSGRPSMGLGLFIATSLLRHSGASTHFANRSDGTQGAEVSLTWDLPISQA